MNNATGGGSGHQYWVSPNGSDTTDGLSQATAFKTLQHAESVTNPGDVVNVLPGTYTAPDASGVLEVNRGGSADAWITYKAAPGAIIQVSPNNWMGVEVMAPYIVLEGFEIIGNARNVTMSFALQHANDGTIPQTNSYGVGIHADHVQILNNSIHDNSGHGIGGGGDYVVIAGNEVYGNGNWSPYATGGVSQGQQGTQQFDNAPGYHNFIFGNRIHDNVELIDNMAANGAITDGNGIIIDSNQLGPTPYTGRTLISNNVLANNGAAGVNVFQSAHVDVFSNTSVDNNLNVKEGEIRASHASDVLMSSNIMIARSDGYATGGNSDTNVTYDYNFVAGPATYGATPDGPHDILAYTLFGEFGNWTPIGAVQTANGYEIALKNSGTDQYTVWTTDSNGNYSGSLIGAVSGNSYALESLEPAFNQDLNGDGTIGPSQTDTISASLLTQGDVENNNTVDLAWRASDAQTTVWAIDAPGNVAATSLGAIGTGWTILHSGHYLSGSTTQMLTDYTPTGTMTLWWVNNGTLTGINLGQHWPNISYVDSGTFILNGVDDILVKNNVDNHMYVWWINSTNDTLTGVDLGAYWANISYVAGGNFLGNGSGDMLVKNNVDNGMYVWWVNTANDKLTGINLGTTGEISATSPAEIF